MKSFGEYLTESADRVYEFKIKLSYEPTDREIAGIENVLKGFDMVSLSPAQRLPIQEHPADFANRGPVEVHVFEASVRYPVTGEQLRNLIRERAGVNDACLIVRTRKEDADFVESYIQERAKKPVLTSELEDVKNDSSRTDRQAESMLKELAKNRRTPHAEPVAPNKEKFKSTNDIPQGNDSPVGSRQNKIPNPASRR
jgi:hypothetical protein